MVHFGEQRERRELHGERVALVHHGTDACAEPGHLTPRQAEPAPGAISRHIKRRGRIFIRIFPDKPTSQKPSAW